MEDNKSKEELQNITLRPFELSDVDDFMLWASDEKVTKSCSLDLYKSKQQAIHFISNTIIRHPYYMAICLDNRPIGSISVIPNDECRRKGKMGCVLASAYWGRGIALKAVEIVISSIFIKWPNLDRIEALVDVENKASQRVLEKCGFTREGVLRNTLLPKGRVKDVFMFSFVRPVLKSRV